METGVSYCHAGSFDRWMGYIMKTNLNRREFIRAGSGALAALTLGPSQLKAATAAPLVASGR